MATTRTLSLATLLTGLATVDHDVEISGLTLDSRQVKSGDLFVALSGSQTEGHLYIDAAIEAGASVVLFDTCVVGSFSTLPIPAYAITNLAHQLGVIAERFYATPSSELFVVGVTGTNGKTSCAHFLAQAMNDEKAPAAVMGTLGNGLFNQLNAATHTTPDAITLHALLRSFVDQGAQSLVMEVSSHGLQQGRVEGVKFDTAVFTNLSRDHLDYHGDMARYGQAKARLFELPGLRHAVINGDDAFGEQLLVSIPTAVETVVYSLSNKEFKQPCVRGEIIHQDREGLTIKIESPWGHGQFSSLLLGRFNASNLLAVLATLLLKGMGFDLAIKKLSQLDHVAGRMERLGGQKNQPLIIVDYAHTPDALQQALMTLREHCQAQLWCVFGCGGDRDKGKRPEMGAIVAQYADQFVVTTDNPRHEDADAIVQDILAGIDLEQVSVIRDRAIAIRHAVLAAKPNDIVLIAGKGHEDYQQVGDQRLPFSDIAQVQLALAVAA